MECRLIKRNEEKYVPLVKTGRKGKARRIRNCPWSDSDTGFYECGDSGGNQGRCVHRGFGADPHPGGIIQYLSFTCKARRQGYQAAWRASQIYVMEKAYSDGFRRLPGFFPGRAP